MLFGHISADVVPLSPTMIGGKMKYRFLLVFLILGCIYPTSVAADALRGDQFLAWLTGKSSSAINQARTKGYIQGMLELYVILSYRNPNLNIYCVQNKRISTLEATDVIVKWLKNHPKRLKEPASLLVLHALKDAYPCNKQTK
jgi:hypothetical protein